MEKFCEMSRFLDDSGSKLALYESLLCKLWGSNLLNLLISVSGVFHFMQKLYELAPPQADGSTTTCTVGGFWGNW